MKNKSNKRNKYSGILSFRYIPLILLAFLGITISVLLFNLSRHWWEKHLQELFIIAAQDRVSILRNEIAQNMRLVKDLVVLFSAAEEVEREEFRTFVQSRLELRPSIKALEWIPRVQYSERAIYEEAARRDGFTDFQITERESQGHMVKADSRDEYFPVYFVEPYKSNELALGYDLASNPAHLEALRKARETGQMVATAPVKLVQETGNQNGFLVFGPVYRKGAPTDSIENRRKHLEGFALGVYRICDILEDALTRFEPQSIEVYLFDISILMHETLLASHSSSESKAPPNMLTNFKDVVQLTTLRYVNTINVIDRTWLVLCLPTQNFFAKVKNWQSRVILCSGLVFTFLLVIYVLRILIHSNKIRKLAAELSTGKDRLEKEVVERKRAEEELTLTKSRLEYLLRSGPTIIYSCKISGDFAPTFISENVSAQLGYSDKDFLNDPAFWLDHIHEEDVSNTLNDVKMCLKKGHHIYDYRFLHKDGTYRWMRNDLRLVRDDIGNPSEMVGSMTDITEQKQLEEQFYQSQKMEAIGRLAGGVAHDFNNLLQTILGYSEFILDQYGEKEPLRKDVEQINDAGKKAALLTRQLLALSRKQAIKPVLLDLNVIISDMNSLLKRIMGEDIDLVTLNKTKINSIKADQGQIEQIIMNLAVNARDAMKNGGRLIIRTENMYLNKDQCAIISESRPGKYVCLTIEDTGMGIERDVISRIFEPFFTTKGKEKGTGLGLSTVYGIVKQNNGWINVSSNLGKGTIFKVFLPAFPEEPEYNAKEEDLLLDSHGEGERILLVEDEEGVRQFVAKALRDNGYVVFDASYVQEAIDIFKRENGTFHLVLSDVVLPDASGLYLIDELKLINSDIKVLFSSGYTDQKSQWPIIKEKGFKFLQKPYPLVDLLRVTKEAIQS
jgi:PAS domain S-box-containing protein